MPRTDDLRVFKEELEELLSRLEDAIDPELLSRSEDPQYAVIRVGLETALEDLDLLIEQMDANDEREYYDEDGNLEDDGDLDLDGTIS